MRWPHTFLVPFGKAKTKDNWDEEEATFRLQTLFKIMFYCARYGRRVREQVLAFGIFPDIDRSSVGVTVYRPPPSSLKRACFFTLSR